MTNASWPTISQETKHQRWRSSATSSNQAARAHVAKRLCPQSPVWPLTPNGKLDRKALPLPDLSLEGEFVAPRNATETRVAQIWAEVWV